MPQAKSIADLMRIRAHEPNRQYLDSINGTLGTALGFRRSRNELISDEPAVIVYVPEKIHRKWIPGSQLLKSKLRGPDGLECPLDVISGSRALDQTEIPQSDDPISRRLRGFDARIYCGSQISSANSERVEVGTLGLFAFKHGNGVPGFVTNRHVAVGSDIFHPWSRGSSLFPNGTRRVGILDRNSVLDSISVSDWYGDFVSETAYVHVDAAFVEIDQASIDVDHDICVEPLIGNDTGLPTGRFGDPLRIDRDELEQDLGEIGLIGLPVFHVGRTTGLRKGVVSAFSYEWQDHVHQTSYADLLISGERIRVATGEWRHEAFSAVGDSGSVVFAIVDGVKRPVALLWGGRREGLRGGDSLDHWSYATRLSPLLDRLNLKVVTDSIEFR